MSDPSSSFLAIVDSAARAAATMAGEAAAAFAVPSAGLDQPSVLGAQSALRPLLLGVLTAAVLVQSLRIVLVRRAEPLAAVATGLARFVLATALGLGILQAALLCGDALAQLLLSDPARSATDVGTIVAGRLTSRDGLAEPFLLLLAAVCVLVLAAALWMALVVRQIALLVIAATLPLAAAGSVTASTRCWLLRLAPWALALVVYKPAAALVFGIGAGYLRSPGAPTGTGGALAGIVVLGLAVGVLPASLRLLSWTTVRVAAGGWGTTAPTPGATGAVARTGRVQGATAVALAGFVAHTGPGTIGAVRATGPVLPRPGPTAAGPARSCQAPAAQPAPAPDQVSVASQSPAPSQIPALGRIPAPTMGQSSGRILAMGQPPVRYPVPAPTSRTDRAIPKPLRNRNPALVAPSGQVTR